MVILYEDKWLQAKSTYKRIHTNLHFCLGCVTWDDIFCSTHLFVNFMISFFQCCYIPFCKYDTFFQSLICWCTAQLFPFSSHYELRSKPIFPYQEVKSFGYIPKSDIAETWCRFYLHGPWETLILISIITLQVVTSTSKERMFSLYHILSNINGQVFFLIVVLATLTDMMWNLKIDGFSIP